MARCSRQECGRWRPDALVRRGGIGIRVDDAWYCSGTCLERAMRTRLANLTRPERTTPRPLPPSKLGTLLLAADCGLTADLLTRGLEAQRLSGRRLGQELLRMQAVASDDVLKALARQANTRYLTTIDPGIVRQGHGNLSRDMVRALGLVPFEATIATKILKVAYVAPLPRVALAALGDLTGWNPEPYLVDDEIWPALLEGYGTNAPGGRVPTATADTLGDASARIARAAEASRAARISHARFDPYVWVRVEASDQVQDLLVTVPRFFGEDTWLMGHTSH
jgi:hypothetical protein